MMKIKNVQYLRLEILLFDGVHCRQLGMHSVDRYAEWK